MRARGALLILIVLSLIAACAVPPTTTPGGVTVSLAPEAVTTTPPSRPTVAPTVSVLPPTAAPATPTLSISLLAEWDAPSANDLAWFPDGSRLAIASSRGIYLYDAATLQEQQFIDVGGAVNAVAISSDQQTLAAALAN